MVVGQSRSPFTHNNSKGTGTTDGNYGLPQVTKLLVRIAAGRRQNEGVVGQSVFVNVPDITPSHYSPHSVPQAIREWRSRSLGQCHWRLSRRTSTCFGRCLRARSTRYLGIVSTRNWRSITATPRESPPGSLGERTAEA